jgi:hypothetical protein
MKKTTKPDKPMRSFDEYTERFFPALSKRKNVPKDPKKASVILVQEELEKLRTLLQAIK